MAKTAKKAAAKAPAKAAAKKAPAKKTAPKKAAVKKATPKKAAKRKVNPALLKPLSVSPTLAEIVGNKPLPRPDIIKKIWEYIKKHKLQDTVNKRMINADEKLKPLFGKGQVSMFDLAKIVSTNIKLG